MNDIFEYNIWSFGLSLIYGVIGLFLLLLLLSRKTKVRSNEFTALLLSASLLMGFFLLNHLFKFKALAPDSSFYADIVRDFWNYYDSWSPGVRLYAIINFIPIQFSMRFPVVLVVIHVFFYLAGMIFLGKALALFSSFRQRSVPKDYLAQLLLLSALYPAALIVIPSLLREGSMFFFFGLSTYLLVLIRYGKARPKKWQVLLFIGSLTLLTLIRPIGGVSYLIGLLSIYFLDLWKVNKLQAILKTALPALLGLWLINTIADGFYNMQFSPDWLGRYRASHEALFGAEAYGTQLSWEGGFNVVKSSLLLFGQYLLSPLPVIIDKGVMFEKTIPLLDAIFITICLIPLLYLLKDRAYRPIYFFAFILLFVSALFETHISGSYRHRMNGVALLLPLVVIGANKLLVDLTKVAINQSKNEGIKE